MSALERSEVLLAEAERRHAEAVAEGQRLDKEAADDEIYLGQLEVMRDDRLAELGQ